MIGYSFMHKGRLWEGIWLDTDSKLTHANRENILKEIADCYVEKESKRNIKEDNYEAIIYAREYFQSLEGFAGRRFDVELETNTRRSKLSGLVAEILLNYQYN
jgi:hypothetical protein